MDARAGVLNGEIPQLVVGAGPPLVVLAGLSPQHANPRGADRRMQLRMVQPLAQRFTVHLVSRRPNLPPGTTMHDLAADVAAAIRAEFGRSVPVAGMSTGGAIALQLAIDADDLVRRLVLLSSACRLSPFGRDVQRRLAELTEAGRPRAASAALGPTMATSRIGVRVATALMWLVGPYRKAGNASDMLATIRAEDAFDVCDQLHRITAPALVVAGGRDRFYSPELFAETARRIPSARLLLYPRKGHAGAMLHRPAQREIVAFLSA